MYFLAFVRIAPTASSYNQCTLLLQEANQRFHAYGAVALHSQEGGV